MPASLFTAKVIAVLWDFDQTLIPGYQQKPLFDHYGIDANEFWDEVNELGKHYANQHLEVTNDTLYLNHLLMYVKDGHMKGLTNAKLREFGAALDFYDGMPEFMATSKAHIEKNPKYSAQGITVEHYIVSTGLRQIILGSAVAKYVKRVWACEFIEQPAARGFLKSGKLPLGEQEISQVGYFLDNTSKTRALFEINKGSNVETGIGVNDTIAPEDRRVPFRNMIFIADGPSDIPVFSILNANGGRTLGVYNPSQDKHFRNVKALQDQGRVHHFTEADYRPERNAAQWILTTLDEIAEAILTDRAKLLKERVHPSVGHVT